MTEKNQPAETIGQNAGGLIMRIGKTTFLVSVKPSETAEKPIESAFRNLCIHEALEGFSASEKTKSGEIQKTS